MLYRQSVEDAIAMLWDRLKLCNPLDFGAISKLAGAIAHLEETLEA